MNRNFLPALVMAACAASVLPFAHAQDGAPPKKSDYKPQSAVAAKGVTFATIPANDPAVKAALDAKALEKAKAQVGKTGSFTGTVVKVFAPASNKIVILNFAADYKAALTAVVKGSSFTKFPDLATLKDKKVLVTGKFVDYKGGIEVDLTGPEQVKIIK